ncbi:MAG: hypothetical protein R3F59_07475 [Myxococcota bacterium]
MTLPRLDVVGSGRWPPAPEEEREDTGPTSPLAPPLSARGRRRLVDPALLPRRVAMAPVTAEAPRFVRPADPDEESTDRPLQGNGSGDTDPSTLRPRSAEPPPLPAHLLQRAAVAPRAALKDPVATPAPPPSAPSPPLPVEPTPTPPPDEAAPESGHSGCLSMAIVPASAAFGLTLALVAVVALLLGTSARDVSSARAAAEGAQRSLHDALHEHIELVDRLGPRSGQRDALDAAFQRYVDARDEPEHTEAAVALVEALDRAGARQEDGAELSYRLKQVRSARADYQRAEAAWVQASATPFGRVAVQLGLAAGAPRE